ncbi:MAG: hypothetical protein SOW59_04900 [Corynebacterium sp.]|nr:hypothetical protein [Corynebacterium sp.]
MTIPVIQKNDIRHAGQIPHTDEVTQLRDDSQLPNSAKKVVLVGVILAELTFWLFSQSMLNIGPLVGE